jgi:hypothetical protein
MTSKTKTEIKAFFETGDKPTEAQFIDFIDSYVDKSGPLGDVEAAISAGSQGFAFSSAGDGKILNAQNARNFMGITVYTTALAAQAFGGQFATTAEATAAAATDKVMSPFLTRYVINDLIVTAGQTTRGLIEIATTAEFNTGTDTERAVTPSLIKTGLGFSKPYTSPEQTITAAGSLTLAHGLGVKPQFIQILLKCQTGEFGYSSGDELFMQYGDNSGSANGIGVSIVPDATNLNIRYGSSAVTFVGIN